MSASETLPAAASATLRQDARTIGLVGSAHATSHFFHMLLPPLFPLFIRDFGFSYAELGLLVTSFFVVSGIGQASSGFLVDRVGARPVLFAAFGCFILSAFAAATAQGYSGLVLAAVLAGLGNAPFHPVDFTILNKRVSQPRLGHAFSAHGISGNLGWAAAPVFLLGITAATGSWRIAVACAGVCALVVLAVLVWQRDAIDDRAGHWAHQAPGSAKTVVEHPMAFLRLPSVWLCFSFFFWSTCAIAAIQGFAGPALQRMHGLSISVAALVITGFMLAGAAGMIAGGFLVARSERLERVIGASLCAAAAALCLAGSGWLPGVASAAVAALAGFGLGLAGPSRDMLIKRASPPNATGRVYGTVYSGLDLGFAIGAPVFGAVMDRGQSSFVFFGAALALMMGVLSAGLVGNGVARRRARAAGAVQATA